MYPKYTQAYPEKEKLKEAYQQEIMSSENKSKIHTSNEITQQEKKDPLEISFNNELYYENLKKYKIIVVKAWAKWCQPCLHASKKIGELSHQLQDYIKLKHLLFMSDDIDSPNSLHREKVQDFVIPAFFIYYKGELDSVYPGNEYSNFIQKLSDLLQK